MAINTLTTATLFQKTLDKAAVQDAVTGWMEGNAGQVIYNGGAEVKIPKLSVQGLADYDKVGLGRRLPSGRKIRTESVKCHFNEWYSGTGRYADNCPECYCEIPAQPDL